MHFDEIKGKKGTALFFAPGLLHQGNSYKNRLDFHLRFSKFSQIQVGLDRNKKENHIYKTNKYQDFHVYNPFSEDFNLEDHDLISKMKKPTFMKKVKGSINYYTGIFNIIKYFRSDFNILRKLYTDKNIKVSLDLKSNTIFQN